MPRRKSCEAQRLMGFENLFWGLEFLGQFSAVLLLHFWGEVRMNCAARRLRGTLIGSRGFCQAWLRDLGGFCSRDVDRDE